MTGGKGKGKNEERKGRWFRRLFTFRSSRLTFDVGFTMIEMLISLSIFAVVTAFVTANFRAGRQSDEIRLSSQLVATAIRRAQTLAIAGQASPSCVGGANDKKMCLGGTAAECPSGACVIDVPKGGYGIRLTTVSPDSRKVILFADLDGDRAYDAGELMRSDTVSPGPFVAVTALNPVASNVLDIVFEPPKPKTWLNNSVATPIATITLSHTTTGSSKTVTVNAVSGQVNAD